MRSRYRILNPHSTYFITGTTIEWLPIFTTAERCNILTEALSHCQTIEFLKIYSWVILDTHFHAVVSAPELSNIIRKLKSFTARKIINKIEEEKCEWLLKSISEHRLKHKVTSTYQVWQEGSHPQEIVGEAMLRQKIDYIHLNPVRRGLVCAPMHWRYSSAHEGNVGAEPLFKCDRWM